MITYILNVYIFLCKIWVYESPVVLLLNEHKENHFTCLLNILLLYVGIIYVYAYLASI